MQGRGEPVPVLVVTELTKVYKGKKPLTAVDHITFELGRGEILGLLGPNGAGKTTTIQMLLSTLKPTSGQIDYFGKSLAEDREAILAQVGYASAYSKLPLHLAIEENLDVFGRLYGLSRPERKERTRELLTRFGVWDLRRRTMAGLSAGQTTRVMLAKAFLARPRIALLDEPTASLDPDIAHEVRDFVREQRDSAGVSILYTSHNMDEVAEICDRVLFLDRGKIAAVGTPEELAASAAATRIRFSSVQGLDDLVAAAEARGLIATIEGQNVEIEIDEHHIAELLQELASRSVGYTGISLFKPTLEDYFIMLARRSNGNGGLGNEPAATSASVAGNGRRTRFMRLHRINAVIMRHLYLFPRTLERWAETIYWPVIDLVVWGLTSKWVETAGSEVPQLALILLTGVVFWQVVWRANYEISVNLLEEFWNQNMVNLFATPLSVWEWSVGLVVLGLIKNVLTLVIGAGAVWVLYRLNIFAVGWAILPFLFSLLISGWFMGFAGAGVIVYYGRKVQSIAWIAGFALAPFSAVYYPLAVLPGWARAIASALPMTYIFEGMRQVLRGGPMPLQDLFLSFGLNFLYLGLAIGFFAWMFDRSRDKGLGRLD